MSSVWKPKTSLNTAAFPPGTPIDRMLTDTAEAGFDAVEFVISSDGPLTFDLPDTTYIEIAKQARDVGLLISGLFLREALEINVASLRDEARETAVEHTVAALDRAVQLGTNVVIVIPGVVGPPGSSSPWVSYEEAYLRSLDALLQLRFEAERRAIQIVCLVGSNRFLLSPMETREFMDRINSPWVRVCLNTAEILSIGYPQDWILGLGHRLARVYLNDCRLGSADGHQPCHLGDGDIHWPEIMAALRDIEYRGLFAYNGGGYDLNDIELRLERILEM